LSVQPTIRLGQHGAEQPGKPVPKCGSEHSPLRPSPCYSGTSWSPRAASWRPLRGLSRRRSRVRVPSLPSSRPVCPCGIAASRRFRCSEPEAYSTPNAGVPFGRTAGAGFQASANGVLGVEREVAVGAVDHLHARPHQPCEFEDRHAAASASVANVCRRWYGPRRSRPAASSAGYQSRVRQLSSDRWPPSGAVNSSGTSSRLGVVPKHVVHPGLLGGWGCQRPTAPRRRPDEAAR
jgi:hypothetical protein